MQVEVAMVQDQVVDQILQVTLEVIRTVEDIQIATQVVAKVADMVEIQTQKHTSKQNDYI